MFVSGFGARTRSWGVLAFFASLVFVCLAAAGCGSTPSAAGSDSPIAGPIPTAAVEWDPAKLTVISLAMDSDLVAAGTVVKVDEPRWNSADGKQWTPTGDSFALVYETLYVQLDQTFKGAPRWGDPVAFRVWTNTTQGRPSLAVGDKVVAFGVANTKLYGPEGVYEPADAYWLTADNNSLWVEKEGTYVNQGHTRDADESSMTLADIQSRALEAQELTTTLPGQFQEPPSTEAFGAAGGFSDAALGAVNQVLHQQFLHALVAGDVEGVRACLVQDRKADAEKLCADAAQWQKEKGTGAAWGGFTETLLWTGQAYEGTPSIPVPDYLTSWIKQAPGRRLGIHVVMGDNAIWWFGMEREGNGTWLVWPGTRDTTYASSHTLAGLDTIKIVAIPRPGVSVTLRLQQLPDSGSVWVQVDVENKSDSVFTLAPSDITLEVDGKLALISLMPHAPGLMTVQPGQVDNPGNGWGWLFDGPTSRTTRLTYTPSDPGSDKRTWAADSAQ